jgi:hypothetical protein
VHFLYIVLLFITTFNQIISSMGQLHFKNDLKSKLLLNSAISNAATAPFPCSCAVFMSGQFKKGSIDQPKGSPALIQELDFSPSTCNPTGIKMCINKCLESIVKHLPNSPAIICGTIDRDCQRERAYLFVKCDDNKWINSNLSAGREYCCKSGEPVNCL